MGIGPSTKETTLHHFRDPLLSVLSSDEELDLVGVLIVGTPDSNIEKELVGKITGNLVSALNVKGVVISADGWGNSHVDFENTIREIGERDIPVVGVTFLGSSDFVVKNSYMDTIVDTCKCSEGVESEVVGENSLSHLDAKKAAALLKLKMRRAKNGNV